MVGTATQNVCLPISVCDDRMTKSEAKNDLSNRSFVVTRVRISPSLGFDWAGPTVVWIEG